MIQDLTRIALVGTSRSAGGLPLDADHPAEALLSPLAMADPESALLIRAGVHAVFAAAGRTAQPGVAAIAVAPPEIARTQGVRLLGILQNVMAADSKDLLAEMLRQMAAGNLHLPHEILPEALAISDATLRERLLPVLGERGRWLSRFNPEWRWVDEGIGVISESDEGRLRQVWDDGAIPERCRVLRSWRRRRNKAEE